MDKKPILPALNCDLAGCPIQAASAAADGLSGIPPKLVPRAKGVCPTAGGYISLIASTSTTRFLLGTPAASACASIPFSAAFSAFLDPAFKIK